MNAPSKVGDVYKYWEDPPPEPSPRVLHWQKKIRDGWRPNARVRQMGYDEASTFFGVYVWEYFNVIQPLLYDWAKK